MPEVLVRDLMVELADYVMVRSTATLAEAVAALARAHERQQETGANYRHRALLVTDASGKTIGKLSMVDVLRALVPGPSHQGALSRLGFSDAFVDKGAADYERLGGVMASMCARVASATVDKIMTVPSAREYVDEAATLENAIQQLVHGAHQSLLVTRNGDVVGVLRLADVFHAACESISGCA